MACRADFEFLPGVFDAMRRLADAGAVVVIVTNQAGVERGDITVDGLQDLHAWMSAVIRDEGGRVDGIYVCPHGAGDGCACRKPRPGLLRRAAGDLGFRLQEAWMVGNRCSDVEAACAAGCRAILVGAEPSPDAAHIRADDLAAAVDVILSRRSRPGQPPPARTADAR